MKFEHIFFDLDGTLTDSQDGILNSFKNVFIHFGLEIPDYQTLCTYIGPPLPFTFAEILGFSKEKTEESIKVFRNYYNESLMFIILYHHLYYLLHFLLNLYRYYFLYCLLLLCLQSFPHY